MILLAPRDPFFLASPPAFGDVSFPGNPATSEKKNEVLTVGVRGVRGAPFGVLRPKPPGEKRPFAVGDCSHARTTKDHVRQVTNEHSAPQSEYLPFDESKEPE